MKKILSIIFALIIAATNNVGYQQQDSVVYQADNYYKITADYTVNYRKLYEDGADRQGSNGCLKGFIWASNARKVIYRGSGGSSETPKTNPYWLVDNQTVVLNSIPTADTITISSNALLVAPVNCKIETSNKSGTIPNNSIRLHCTLGGSGYTIRCENLERWWCCIGRTPPGGTADEFPEWEHTCPESQGRTLTAGRVIGRAVGGKTTITITKSDGSATGDGIRGFYQSATH